MSTTLGYALAGPVLAVAALANWYGVLTSRRALVVVAKPLTLAALIAVALTGGAAEHPVGRWLLLGLVLSLAGDIFLLGAAKTTFLAGLVSFLLGHLAYVVAFVSLRLAEPAWGLVGLLLVIGALPFIARIIPGAHRYGGAGFAVAVTAYTLVIAAMVLTAWMTGRWVAGIGAGLFMVSDTVLAANLFLRRHRFGDLTVMVTYHLGQLLIVLGVLTALV